MAINFNVFDQAVLTGVVNRPLETAQEQEPYIGERIAPLVPVQAREVKIQVKEINAFGKGQFRAPGATPPLMEVGDQLREEVIELALLDEMNRIKDEDFLALSSADDNVRRKAGVAIVDRGNILAQRNRRLTEALRWDAFLDGQAVITYPTGATVEVDYGIPASHITSATTPWEDTANSDPIGDLRRWQLQCAVATGYYGTQIHMSSYAYEKLLKSEKLIGLLAGFDRPLLIPRTEDVLALLRDGTNIVITDAGYRAEGVGPDVTGQGEDRGLNSLTPFLPYDKVLVTTPYTIGGERIADMPDGQVIVSNSYNSVSIRQGAQAEVMLEHMSKTHFLRYGSARIPRIHVPGAFVCADVGTITIDDSWH